MSCPVCPLLSCPVMSVHFHIVLFTPVCFFLILSCPVRPLCHCPVPPVYCFPVLYCPVLYFTVLYYLAIFILSWLLSCPDCPFLSYAVLPCPSIFPLSFPVLSIHVLCLLLYVFRCISCRLQVLASGASPWNFLHCILLHCTVRAAAILILGLAGSKEAKYTCMNIFVWSLQVISNGV